MHLVGKCANGKTVGHLGCKQTTAQVLAHIGNIPKFDDGNGGIPVPLYTCTVLVQFTFRCHRRCRPINDATMIPNCRVVASCHTKSWSIAASIVVVVVVAAVAGVFVIAVVVQ